MARQRTLKPGFFTNEELATLPALTRLFFEGLWCWADRSGRVEDRPKRLKAEILPYDDCDGEEMVSQLAARGFLIRYEAAGLKVIQIVNFDKHQHPHPREVESVLPGQDQGKTQAMPSRGKDEPRNGTAAADPDLGMEEQRTSRAGVSRTRTDPPPTRARATLVSPFGEADPHPKTSAVLAGLFARGLDAAPPAATSADRVEAAIAAVGVEAATERIAARLRTGAEKPLTFHVEAIRGETRKQRNGDLGAEPIPWPQRLTPAEREACRRELAALHRDWGDGAAPISVPGDPETHPVEAIRAVQAKYRAIAEARHDA